MADETKPIVWKVCQTYYTESPAVKEVRDNNGQITYVRPPAELQKDSPVCAPPSPGASSDVYFAAKTLDGIKSREAGKITNFSRWNESGKEFIAMRGGIKGKPAATVADAGNNLVKAEQEVATRQRIAQAEVDWKKENRFANSGTRNFQ